MNENGRSVRQKMQDDIAERFPDVMGYRSPPTNRLNKDELDILVALYKERAPVPDIAEMIGVSTGTIYYYLRELRAMQGGMAWLEYLAERSQRLNRPRLPNGRNTDTTPLR